jgi:hypothetical protein
MDQCNEPRKRVEFSIRNTNPAGVIALSCTYQWKNRGFCDQIRPMLILTLLASLALSPAHASTKGRTAAVSPSPVPVGRPTSGVAEFLADAKDTTKETLKDGAHVAVDAVKTAGGAVKDAAHTAGKWVGNAAEDTKDALRSNKKAVKTTPTPR